MKDRLEQLKAVRDPRRGQGTGDTGRGPLRKRVTPAWGSLRPHPMVGRGITRRGDPKVCVDGDVTGWMSPKCHPTVLGVSRGWRELRSHPVVGWGLGDTPIHGGWGHHGGDGTETPPCCAWGVTG